MNVAKSINDHRSTPHISIDQYVRSRVVELGRSLDQRTAIYLDVKFWIILRQAAAGLSTDESHIGLLQGLRSLTTGDQIFCPISESIFMELMKQSDSKSRLRMARLIDELSLGVTLISYDMRLGTELAHFIQSFGDHRDGLYPLNHLIWSKLAYVLGFTHPTSMGFDPATELAIQKAFFDEMWAISLDEMVERIGGTMPRDGADFGELANNLNDNTARHAEELRSFAQAYDVELRGVVDACGDEIMQIMSDMAAKASGFSPSRGSTEWVNSQRQWKNVIYRALKKGPARQQLPSMHIAASLHAAFRWDKSRRFTSNDIYDFQHASAALAHCGAFFTEHSLYSVIAANHIALDRLYGCHVISDVTEALAYLRTFETAQETNK